MQIKNNFIILLKPKNMIKESQKLLFKMDAILDMIAKTERRLQYSINDLNEWHSKNEFSTVKLMYNSITPVLSEVKKYEDIKARLQCYYLTNLHKLGTIFLHKFKN